MNAIGEQGTIGNFTKSYADPYNYPSLNRNNAMTMNTITGAQDFVKTNTQTFVSARKASLNLNCSDIEGKCLIL